MQPLSPGSQLGPYRVEELLSWNQRGGVYRVSHRNQLAILKELLVPEGLAADQRRLRVQNLERAVHAWQKLGHPQAIPVIEFMPSGQRIYLLLPELEGSTPRAQARLRERPPEPAQAILWSDQLADLTGQLLNLRHPLAFELLRDDRLLIDQQANLIVFNPGWSELLWQDTQLLLSTPLAEGLVRYGRLIETLASGDRQHSPQLQDLPAGLIWVVSRCVQPEAGRVYHDVAEVRQALRNLKVLGDGARNSKQLGSLPPVAHFTLPRLAQLPKLSWRDRWLMLLLTTVLLAGLTWLAIRLAAPPPVRPGMALAVGRDLYLHRPQLPPERLWRFPAPVVSLDAHPDGSRLYAILEGSSEVHVLDPDEGVSHAIPLASRPLALSCAEGGKELQVFLENQHLLRLDLSQDRERPLDSVRVESSISAWCYRELAQPGNAQRLHTHHEGLLTLHPRHGLMLYDATTGQSLRSAGQSGYAALLPTPRGEVLLMANSGSWVFLDESFRPRQKGQISLPRGAVQLRVNSSGDHFWSLQMNTEQQTLLGWWQTRELRILDSLKIDSSPLAAATDERGNLWWSDTQLRLYRATANPLNIELVAKLPGPARSMTYLTPDLRPRGLQKMMEELPPTR